MTRLYWHLMKGAKISDAQFVACYLEIFRGGGAMKIPNKLNRWDLFLYPDCVTKYISHTYSTLENSLDKKMRR